MTLFFFNEREFGHNKHGQEADTFLDDYTTIRARSHVRGHRSRCWTLVWSISVSEDEKIFRTTLIISSNSIHVMVYSGIHVRTTEFKY